MARAKAFPNIRPGFDPACEDIQLTTVFTPRASPDLLTNTVCYSLSSGFIPNTAPAASLLDPSRHTIPLRAYYA